MGCKGASCRGVVGRCHKQMEWAQTFRPLLGSILDKSRPFWGAGQTRPLFGFSWGAGQGLSATSWAHLWGAGRTSPGLSATSWAYLGERGKQVQIRVIEPFRIASRCGTLQPCYGEKQKQACPGHRTFSQSKQTWDLTVLLWGQKYKQACEFGL